MLLCPRDKGIPEDSDSGIRTIISGGCKSGLRPCRGHWDVGNELINDFHAFILAFYLGLDAFLQGGDTQPLCSRVSQGRVQRRAEFACFKLIVLFRADT